MVNIRKIFQVVFLVAGGGITLSSLDEIVGTGCVEIIDTLSRANCFMFLFLFKIYRLTRSVKAGLD